MICYNCGKKLEADDKFCYECGTKNIVTEEELAIYKSGRNSKSAHRSKSASAVEYRRATGLECLYGYFWLSAQHDRARDLFLQCVE